MFAPGARHRSHVPPSATPFVLGLVAVLGTILLWAALAAVPASDERSYPALARVDASAFRAVAYSVPRDGFDAVMVRATGGGVPRQVAAFPYAFNLHAHGAASPLGDRLALLHIGSPSLAGARLSVVALPSGDTLDVEGVFDFQSPAVWAPTGNRLALTARADDGTQAVIREVHALTGAAAEVARFDGALEAVPVGYSLDGTRLFVVVVDQSGSSLWVQHDGQVEKLVTYSPGLTRDWSLSPDGARLAFVDRLGVGGRTYAGRVLVIAAGTVSDLPAVGDQLGASWRPGSDLPDFGGPGGNLQLTGGDAGATYVFPLRWSPDGSQLAAAVYAASREGVGEPSETIEIVSSSRREALAPEPGARFLGWVRDVE
ncbi:MAG: PD40 domain-containing protein [Dehalococcoidia bacterium]|nr:PD40 domain-containing protein [Dehalococcoidia bacterium]